MKAISKQVAYHNQSRRLDFLSFLYFIFAKGGSIKRINYLKIGKKGCNL